jgi:hypothetical protein
MNSNISAGKIVGDTLYVGLDSVLDDSVLRRMADCVRQLRPAIDRAVARHGHGATLAALIAIAANEAIDVGTGKLIAEAIRHNAEMLEAHETVRAVAGRA